jgi:adenosine deaminase
MGENNGRIKEYVYQKQHAAENRIKQLMDEGAEFTVCTEDQLRHVSPITTDE